MNPHSSVILCATPRSGSTLLCDLLTATGPAGVVQSYFRHLSIDAWISRFGLALARTDPDFDATHYRAALKAGTDASGTFGLRMMWDNVGELSDWLDRLFPGHTDDRARLAAAFGPPRFILLSRRDKIAQAVSRLRAEQSGLWHLCADSSERERTADHREPVYGAAQLTAFIAEAEASEDKWRGWFSANGITPVPIAYEDLAAQTGATLAGLLAKLGRDPAAACGVTPISARMADGQSLDWCARYRREVGLPVSDRPEADDPLA